MSSKSHCACIGLLCLSSFLGNVSLATPATEHSLEDLLNLEVESASRYAQPLSESPSNVTVINAEDIRRFGFRDLAEALQMAPGIHITRDRTYSYLGTRGFSQPGDYNSRILLLQDGARINDPLYDQAVIGNEAPLHLDWVKRVEFVAGASSVNYGGNALFGIANTILWSGADIAGTRVNFSAGNGRFGEVSLLSGGVSEGGLDWLVGLTSASQRGEDIYFREFDQPSNNNGVAHNLDGERYTKGLFKFSQGAWRGSFNFMTRDKEVPTAYYDTVFNAQGNFVQDRSAHFDLTHNTSLNPNWNQQVRLHAGHYQFNAEYPLASLTTLNRDESRASWLDVEYSLLYSGLKEHRILLGAQIGRGYSLSQSNFDILPSYTLRLDDRRNMLRSGFFIQDEWLFDPRWHLNWGVRMDQQTDQTGMTSPRIALIHRHNDALTLKGSLARAFRYANLYERFYQDGGLSQNPSPNLKPEQIDSRELSADYLLNPNLRLSLGAYQYYLRNLITLLPDPANASLLLFQNQEKMRAKGWESQLEAMLSGGWRLRLGFNWQYARQEGDALVNSPQHLGKLLLDGPLPWANWTLGINLQGVGERRTTKQGHAPGFVTGNVVLRQKQERGSAWSFALYNWSGKRYLDTGSSEHRQELLPSNGREWRIRWGYGF